MTGSLSKAFALAAASDAARAIREEVGFFQAIRAALIKSVPGDGKRGTAERELAIHQIVSRAVVSTEIVDIMKAAGLDSPDISILSDEFLAEVRDTPKKNLAIEALKKLINGGVRSHAKSNVTQSKAFRERLEAAIARYHGNAITTAQVLEELIRLAKDIRAARARGEEVGLSAEEIAFYDALAQNEGAKDVMGEPALRVIAHELVQVIKSNVSIAWMRRTSARANIRRHVKRLLRKFGIRPTFRTRRCRMCCSRPRRFRRNGPRKPKWRHYLMVGTADDPLSIDGPPTPCGPSGLFGRASLSPPLDQAAENPDLLHSRRLCLQSLANPDRDWLRLEAVRRGGRHRARSTPRTYARKQAKLQRQSSEGARPPLN